MFPVVRRNSDDVVDGLTFVPCSSKGSSPLEVSEFLRPSPGRQTQYSLWYMSIFLSGPIFQSRNRLYLDGNVFMSVPSSTHELVPSSLSKDKSLPLASDGSPFPYRKHASSITAKLFTSRELVLPSFYPRSQVVRCDISLSVPSFTIPSFTTDQHPFPLNLNSITVTWSLKRRE